ncbi:4'-phosphopantetheinyl transferase superfamily protein [Elizabethkingia anophelis]|uniref:4'-phosphopantetheinyl transferase n=1 Tax=Elizabethkingia anophelis TaxID=1117645 RepID=A0AAE4P031_9FLAO|nr:4'-phosphopantetheinyl transferase superfamily protein [Elizabethkingia anophelis]MCT3920209.1 4'-phosphopantetheinyl transferase superfamily protein [Elizabethkingia anophelis]MCT3952564.1 4'-phosphopantetheinyl transferase superfamily protein [Elizabethkingia anophelis]MCT3956190.1 4'-phosphopantetheinyl transferase superfamily protein [Elizabethkingia anophelis]MCT3987797.1 4'-phosphopantetheinyl transferase superfamily protein [Elizabethkingia anophelis]
MEVILFYTFISQNASEEIDAFFRTLPEELRFSISQYQNQKDRQARVLSKILAEKLFRQFYPDHQLDWKRLKKDENSKPYLEDYHFNFSSAHSEDLCVVCASVNNKCGVDVEVLNPLDVSVYKDFLHSEEQDYLLKSQNSVDDFYNIWVKKEAVIKASGLGVSKELNEVNTLPDCIQVNGQDFFTNEVFISELYKVFIASENPSVKISVYNISID